MNDDCKSTNLHCAVCGHEPTCANECGEGDKQLVRDGVRGVRPEHAETDPVAALARIREAASHEEAAEYLYTHVGMHACDALWGLAYGRTARWDGASLRPACLRLATALRNESARAREVLDDMAAHGSDAARRTLARLVRADRGLK